MFNTMNELFKLYQDDPEFREFLHLLEQDNNWLINEYQNNKLYEYIISNPKLINVNKHPSTKIQLDKLIKYFEHRSEFEKCQQLLKIKN